MRFPVVLVLQPSQRQVRLLAAAHLSVALPLLFLGGWPSVLRIGLLLCLCFSFAWGLQKIRFTEMRCLMLREDGSVSIKVEATWGVGRRLRCVDQGWAVWLSVQIALSNSTKAHTLYWMLCEDSFEAPDGWHLFRIWCRHKATHE